MHQRNLQTHATEIYIALNKISREIVNWLFEFTNKNYVLRNMSLLKRKRNFTVHYGSEKLSSLAPKIMELVPDSIREEKTSIFKNTLHKKMKFSIKGFFSKCDQILSFLRILPHLLKKILNGKLHFFCSVSVHVDFAKLYRANWIYLKLLQLFSGIIFIAVISSFLILGHTKN